LPKKLLFLFKQLWSENQAYRKKNFYIKNASHNYNIEKTFSYVSSFLGKRVAKAKINCFCHLLFERSNVLIQNTCNILKLQKRFPIQLTKGLGFVVNCEQSDLVLLSLLHLFCKYYFLFKNTCFLHLFLSSPELVWTGWLLLVFWFIIHLSKTTYMLIN